MSHACIVFNTRFTHRHTTKTLRREKLNARSWFNTQRRDRVLRAHDMLFLQKQLKSCRRADGPSTSRHSERALRASHFRAAAASPTFDRTSWLGRLRWSFSLCSHNVLARGADLGLADLPVLPDFRRNVVVSDAVLDGPASLVLRQAENRLHAQTAVLEHMLSSTAGSESPLKLPAEVGA